MFTSSPRVLRSIAGIAAVCASAMLATACSSDSDGDGGNEVRVGLVCGGLTPMAAQLAMNGDTFSDDISVEKVCFDSGSDAMQALIGGSLDVFMGSTEHILSTRGQGLPIRGYAGINMRAPYALITEANSDVESVADLDGQTVGVTSPGSLADTELKIASEQNGLDYTSLEVIGAGSGATMSAAIEQNQVAAGMVSDPQKSEMLQTGDFRLVWEPEFDYASIIAVSNEDWVADNKDSLTAFLTGVQDAAEKAASDADWALETMKKEDFPVSDEALAAAVENGLKGIPDGLIVTEEGYDATIEGLKIAGSVEDDHVLPYDEVFDFSLLEDAS